MKTTAAPLVKEVFIHATAEKVWKAITDKDQMKQWYFSFEEFRAEPGFTFRFEGGDGTKVFVHLCRIIEVVPFRKLSYTWVYEGYQGESLVTFELFPEEAGTRVKLTHEGLENFDVNNEPAFDKKNFEAGWSEIIGTLLKDFAEKRG